MIRILFCVLLFLLFISHWIYFMYVTRTKGDPWFWRPKFKYHVAAVAIATVCAIIEAFALAQTLVFLEWDVS